MTQAHQLQLLISKAESVKRSYNVCCFKCFFQFCLNASVTIYKKPK